MLVVLESGPLKCYLKTPCDKLCLWIFCTLKLESFFSPVRNAIICPEWQFTKPVSSGNISQIRDYVVVPREVNLKRGQCLWPTQENAEGFW